MGSPFYNNFVYLHLRPFSQAEAESLLDQMLKDTNVEFAPRERALIYQLAGTHPLLLQAAAACLFDAKTATGRLDAENDLVLERFMDLTGHQWEDLWRWSTQREQEVLIRLAKNVSEGIALLEETPDEKRNLIKRGLIVQESGTCRLFSPMLRQWLLEHRRGFEQGERRGSAKRTRLGSGRVSTVFLSYSHKDEAEKEALLTHLAVLQRGAELVEVWSDDQISGGEAWEAAIENAVSNAGVAILLITANFLSSEFILGKEVPELLRRREEEGVRVIPVIAKACAWREIDWLAKMNVRPKNGRPIWRGDKGPADDALAEIAEEIASIVKGL